MSFNQTGLSFPFRVGVHGGLVMSTTNESDVSHIEESLTQIFLTCKGERPMEQHFYSEIDTHVFEVTNESTKTLLKYQIVEASKLDSRVTITEDDISFEMVDNTYFINIKYKVLSLGEYYTLSIPL